MSYISRQTIAVQTSSDGAATEYSSNVVYGFVQAIRYVASTSVPFSTNVQIDVSGEVTGVEVLTGYNTTGDFTAYPRAAIVTTTGGSTSGREPVAVSGERVKVVISAGGDTKSGTFHVLTGG